MAFYGDELWKCHIHPSRRWYGGVCPFCLHERLASLCPACARSRPCPCVSVGTCSSSSSSASSLSRFSTGDFFSGAGAIGQVGRVSSLIENEPAFGRSRSMALPFSQSTPSRDLESERMKQWRLMSFWTLLTGKKAKKEAPAAAVVMTSDDRGRMMRKSRSVAVSESGCGRGRFSPSSRGKGWHFPSPMKALKHTRVSKMAFQHSSPLYRG